MDPITLAMLAMAVGTVAKAGAGIGKSVQEGKAQKKYQKYEDQMAKLKKRDQYRSAIARAMGSSNPFSLTTDPKAPKAPDTSGWDVLGGFGQGVGALGQMGFSSASPTQQKMSAAGF